MEKRVALGAALLWFAALLVLTFIFVLGNMSESQMYLLSLSQKDIELKLKSFDDQVHNKTSELLSREFLSTDDFESLLLSEEVPFKTRAIAAALRTMMERGYSHEARVNQLVAQRVSDSDITAKSERDKLILQKANIEEKLADAEGQISKLLREIKNLKSQPQGTPPQQQPQDLEEAIKNEREKITREHADRETQLTTQLTEAQNQIKLLQQQNAQASTSTTTSTTTTTTPASPSATTPHSHWANRWGNANQSVQCIRNGDGSEMCLYESVCDDGASLYFKDSFGDLANVHPPRRDSIDYRYYERYWREIRPPQEVCHPFHIETDMKVVSPDNWPGVFSSWGNVKHVKNAYMIILETPVPQGGNNLWHFSESVSMLLDPQFHNETGMFPPMDTVVIRALGDLKKWNQGMLDLLIPNKNTNVIILQPGERVCADTAMVLGYRRQIFLGHEDGTRFRERAYQRLGLEIHPKQAEELSFPLRIRMFNRVGSRHIESPTTEEISKLLVDDGGNESYDFQVIDDVSPMAFTDQVKLWANADLIIMPHGAGLTNMIFSRNHVPVIEVFPRHFYNELYRAVAHVTNHPYYMLMSEKLPARDFRANPVDEVNCEYWHGIDIMNEGHCHHQYFKHSSITLDNHKLMSTIKLALESLPLVGVYGRRANDPIRPSNDPLGKPQKK